MYIREIDKFIEFFIKALTDKKASFNRMYLGPIADIYHRRDRREELRSENPKFSSAQLELRKRHLPGKSFRGFMKVTSDGSRQYKESLTKKDRNAYGFIWADIRLYFKIESFIIKKYKTRNGRLSIPSARHGRFNRFGRIVHTDGLSKMEIDGENYLLSSGFSQVLEWAKLLNETGYLLINGKSEALTSGVQDLSIESLLNSRGYFINAVIGSKESANETYIITRNNNDSLFVAEWTSIDIHGIECLSEPNLRLNEHVSHCGPNMTKDAVNKMKQGDFPRLEDFEGASYPSLDVGGGDSPEEASLTISIFLDDNRDEEFVHIMIHDINIDPQGDDFSIYKSQVAHHLKQHPLVLGFCSCPEDFGGAKAFFVCLNSEYIPPLIDNFLSGNASTDEENDLSVGYLISRNEFYSLNSERAKSEVTKNIYHYEDYEDCLFNDLVKDRLSAKKIYEIHRKEADQNIICVLAAATDEDELREIAITDPFAKMDITKFPTGDSLSEEEWHKNFQDLLPSNFYYFDLNSEVLAEYVAIFLNSTIGRQIYLSRAKKGVDRRIHSYIDLEDVLNLKILLPDKKLQKKTIEVNEKVEDLSIEVKKIKEGLVQNPSQLIDEKSDQINAMLQQADKLNNRDIVLETIKDIETGISELKASWKVRTKPLKKSETEEITLQRLDAIPFKVINALINSEGGRLILGVENSTHEILGLQEDLDKHFAKPSKKMKKRGIVKTELDKRDDFDKDFGIRLAKTFNNEFIDNEKNVKCEFVEMEENVFVYLITCIKGDKPCLILDKKIVDGPECKGNDFYHRRKSECIPLKDQERMDYIHRHFYRDM